MPRGWVDGRACDPKGIAAGINRYTYVRNRPTRSIDPQGTDDEPGLLERHLGPSSSLGQWVSHADHPGSSFVQDDRKFATAQHVAEGVTIGTLIVATGGAAAELAAGYATADGATALQTTVLSGAAEGVAGCATLRYGITGFKLDR
jgi:hypothetical protein